MLNVLLHLRVFRRLSLLASLIVGFVTSGIALGQMETMRFELGRRLTRFERVWEAADNQGRAACVETMDGAVRSFFGLQLDTAAQLLDRATQNVLGDAVSASPHWLASNRYSIDFETTWVDAQGGALRFRLRQIGSPQTSNEVPSDRNGTLKLAILNGNHPINSMDWKDVIPLSNTEAKGNVSKGNGDSQGSESPQETWYTWELPNLPPGDYQVSAICQSGDVESDLIAESISVSSDLESRMQKVQSWYEENRRIKGNTLVSTAKWLARELRQGLKGEPTEIDIPWNAWLTDFEALRDQQVDYLKSIAHDSKRSFWLQLNSGEKSQIVRLRFPLNAAPKLPVLFAFHGAGGSENMFFEAYGAGRLIDLANQRGWLVVSPRQSLSGLGMDIEEMLNELEAWFPIDRERVMLVGHSMGAAQAVNQVSIHPNSVQAVAALGGGGMPRSSLKTNPVPFFVAAGDRDFGRPRAKSLADSLRNLNCPVDYRDYTNVEHMVIVQAALNDVFAFLDDVAKDQKDSPAGGN
jgi:predicted esterase